MEAVKVSIAIVPFEVRKAVEDGHPHVLVPLVLNLVTTLVSGIFPRIQEAL